MYIRANSYSVVRAGRKLSNVSTLIAVTIASLIFLFIITLIGSDEKSASESDLFYRKAELSTWKINQSLVVADYLDIRNPNSYLIQPRILPSRNKKSVSPFCGPNVKLLIMVTSAPSNVEERQAIRDTWGNKTVLEKHDCRILFVLGRSDNETIDEAVSEEASTHNDIIVEDFHDSYHNLTLKSVALLKWVNLTCLKHKKVIESPKHVLKTDDDIFINLGRLLQVIKDLPGANMIGRLTCGAAPIGAVTSKLYMPKYIYPDKTYPGYLSGTAYVLNAKIIPVLLKNVKVTPLVHLEDIYVTSLLARKSRIYPNDSPYFTYAHIEPKDACPWRYLVNSHQMKPKQMREVWTNLRKPLNGTCNLRKAKWLRRVPRLTLRLRNTCMFT